MNVRKLVIIGMVGLCSLALVVSAIQDQTTADDAQEPAVASERDKWMAVKLSSAQQILEDLTSGQFEDLEASARRMQVMNFLEQWQRDEQFDGQSEYQGQLNAFEFSTKELIRHAQDENVEGALRSYVAMTESCVRCHSLIRDVD